jgi:tRNA-guanine family transglycosylase
LAAPQAFGADIILPLDELSPYHITPAKLAASTARSHRWMARSLAEHLAAPGAQAMYGIIHGGTDAELRAGSAAYLCSLPFGASMRARCRAAVSWTCALTLLHRLVQMVLPLAARWGATVMR